MLYSIQELLLLTAAAIIIDWIIGDPKWPTHPVIWIGRFIKLLERILLPLQERICRTEPCKNKPSSIKTSRLLGCLLTILTLSLSYGVMWVVISLADMIHVWAGYAVSAWFISTTIAIKGLKDAAMLVYTSLALGHLDDARKYAGYIVGRDAASLDERETSRAAVETVAENIVDAVVSPIFYAIIGGAPLAMLYRGANTLDSMVGYRNEKYRSFGWCSARTDDVLNYIPARLTGIFLAIAACFLPGLRAGRAVRAVLAFAHAHPSPNSGIPESAVAGALGIELGGINSYSGVTSERARMGWPIRQLEAKDILLTIKLLYGVSYLLIAGVILIWLFIR